MYYLGIDLGGTNIVAGVVNEDGQIIIKENRKTTRPCTMDALCNDMAEAATAAVVNAGLSKDDLQYIGIGAPGAVNSETVMAAKAAIPTATRTIDGVSHTSWARPFPNMNRFSCAFCFCFWISLSSRSA